MRRLKSAASRTSRLWKSFPYQRSEKPPQTVTRREALKEEAATGTVGGERNGKPKRSAVSTKVERSLMRPRPPACAGRPRSVRRGGAAAAPPRRRPPASRG